MNDRNLIAILRGVTPGEVVDIAHALVSSGITRIEVPLNSPDPMSSINRLVEVFGNRALIGAGTVLTEDQVSEVASTGARLIVSPNTNPQVIRRCLELNLNCYPGVLTPSEGFTALEAGASGLKLFPAEVWGVEGVKAFGAVLPKDTALYAVGGITSENMKAWRKAGVTGFGIGGSLYKPGYTPDQVQHISRELVEAYDNLS